MNRRLAVTLAGLAILVMACTAGPARSSPSVDSLPLTVFGAASLKGALDRVKPAWEAAHPGSVLTSMLKRVDLAAYNSFKAAQSNAWKGGTQVLGLKEGGVDWALDKDNEKLITPEMKAKVDAAKADIVSGKIAVHDYMSNNACK